MNDSVFFKLSSELHCLINIQGVIIRISPVFTKVLQFRNDALLEGKFLQDIIITEDRAKFEHLLQTLKLQHTETFRLNLLSNTEQTIRITGKIYKESDERIYMTAVPNLAQDSPMARFKRFFDLELLDVMVVTDERGRMILPNKGFQQIFGYNREMLKKMTLLRFVHPPDRRILVPFVKDLKTEEGKLRKILIRLWDKDKQLRWMSWRVIFVRGSIYAVANDITELKEQKAEVQKLLKQTIQQNEDLVKSREELQDTLDTLKMRNFELDQFVYRTSHDLRSPLTSILGLVNLARIDKAEPERLMQYIEMIRQSTLKLDDFIQSLLDYSRSGRAEVTAVPVLFHKIFLACKQELAYLDNFGKLKISFEVIGEQNFYSDTLRIQTIFTNILSNAIKYQKPQGKDNFLKVKVNISDETQAVITFQDNGIGIDEAYIQDIFKMFFRATEASVGSGLGLYIVRQTIQKLEGSIQVASIENEGTIFTVILPNLKDKIISDKELKIL